MYSVPQTEQLSIFTASLGLGFLLGILYDIFRAIRLSVTKGKIAVVISDVLYFLCVGLASFLFILSLNKGEIRSYIIAGEVIGAVFYYFSFGIAAMKITDYLVKLLRRFYSFVFKVISAPFRLIKRAFSHLLEKLKIVFKKTSKNSQKMRKKHLPKARMYVYNLFGIFLANTKTEKKGGGRLGKNKKEKEDQ